MFSSIKTHDDAMKTIYLSSLVFIAMAILQIVASLFFFTSFLEGGILAILGLALLFTKNKFVATALLIYSLVLIAPTFVNLASIGNAGGTIFIGILMIFASLKALEATVKLKRLKS